MGATRIYYALSEASPVTVRVFDLSGRLVRVLMDSPKRAGHHEVTWNAHDGSGRSVPSGLYFLKLDTDAGSRVLRVVMTR